MAATKVGIVYSKAQKVRRRLILLDHENADDSQFGPHKNTLLPGEGWIELPLALYEKMRGHDVDIWLAGQIGEAESDRCAVVHGSGEVHAVIKADPRIDEHPIGFLIRDDSALTGDTYDFETGEIA